MLRFLYMYQQIHDTNSWSILTLKIPIQRKDEFYNTWLDKIFSIVELRLTITYNIYIDVTKYIKIQRKKQFIKIKTLWPKEPNKTLQNNSYTDWNTIISIGVIHKY